MRTRAAATAFTLTLTAGAILIAPTDSDAATGPVTSGNGWKLTAPITHLDSRPWAIAFHDTASRSKLTPYLRNAAAELTSYTGVKFTVTTRIVSATAGKCPPTHTITYRYTSKPNPAVPNQSFAGACSLRGAAYSGYAFINSDYWLKTRNFPEWLRMNVIWHETAHTIGLSHPTTCPTNKAGVRPLMCADTYKDLRTRRYTPYEATALRRLALNRAYYPLP